MFKKIIQFLFSALGSAIIGVGTAIAVGSGYGADALGFLWEAISYHWPSLSIGVASIIFFALCFVVVLIIDRKQIGLSTLINPLVTSFFVAFILAVLPSSTIFYVKIIAMLLGITLIGLGAGLSACSSWGKDPYTALVFALHIKLNSNKDRPKIDLAIIRMACDALWFLFALLLGLGLKLGPFVAVLLIGFVLKASYNLAQKIPFIGNN
jgi:uncharacterized membrane protein YczE